MPPQDGSYPFYDASGHLTSQVPTVNILVTLAFSLFLIHTQECLKRAHFTRACMQLMQKIPTTLEDAAQWPVRIDALRLESPAAYKHLLSRVVKYVHEVMPSDEEAIANEVRGF